jgi:hypothetical protein
MPSRLVWSFMNLLFTFYTIVAEIVRFRGEWNWCTNQLIFAFLLKELSFASYRWFQKYYWFVMLVHWILTIRIWVTCLILAVPCLMTRDCTSASMPPVVLPYHDFRFCYVNISLNCTLVFNSGHSACTYCYWPKKLASGTFPFMLKHHVVHSDECSALSFT